MGKIVLVLVAAAWAAVLLPPLLRGRTDGRSGSSVVDFRRQLSTLQRSTPMRGTAMRSMARPLAPTPIRQRGMGPQGYESSGIMARSGRREHGVDTGREDLTRSGSQDYSRSAVRPVSVRQRRQNVLMCLLLISTGSAFIAFTTKSDMFVYVFVLAAMSLASYCYKLSQMRRFARGPQNYRRDWIRAA